MVKFWSSGGGYTPNRKPSREDTSSTAAKRLFLGGASVPFPFPQALWIRFTVCALLFGAAAAVYELFGRNTPWPHLFYLPVIVSAALFGHWGVLVVSLSAGLWLGLVRVPLPDIGRADALSIAAYRFLFYAVVGIAASFLFERAQRSLAQSEQEQQRSGEQLRELNGLHRIDQAILTTPDLTNVTNTIVAVVAEVTGAPLCTLRLVDGDFRHLALTASYGASAEYLADHVRAFGEPQRMGEGIASWAVMTGATAAVADVRRDPRLPQPSNPFAEHGYLSLLATPVTVRGRTLGALTIAYREPRLFTVEDVSRISRLGTQMALAIQNAQQTSKLHTFTRETVTVLAEAIEHRDPYTGGHCARLGDLVRATAERLGLPAVDLEQLEYAAILHDVGKVAVPDAVLLKPGPLTPEEWSLMRNHSFVGSQIAKKVEFLQPMAQVIYHHHEQYDGSGYLDGLAGERIPLGARIVAVADAFDAMTNDRPYRKALPLGQAVQELRARAGSQFDPMVVEAFLDGMRSSDPT